jgi:drug/metabolite transporter (DMT)-like permease
MTSVSAKQAKTPSLWPHLALLLVQIAFASQAVESKLAMQPAQEGGLGLDPTAIAQLRMIGAAIIFQALLYATTRKLRITESGRSLEAPSLGSHEAQLKGGREELPAPHPGSQGSLQANHAKPAPIDQLKFFGLSLVGITINQALFLAGLKRTAPVVAALLSITIPVSVALLNALFGKERLTTKLILGLACSGLGIFILTGITSLDSGAVLIAVNSVSYAAYVVLSRGLFQKFGALTVVTWVFTWGAISFAPFGMRPLLAVAWTPEVLLFAAYVIAVPTVIAYLCNAWALARVEASVVTGYIPLQPLLAAALAWVQLGTAPSPRALLATPFVLAGIFWVTRRPMLSLRANS